MKLEELVISLDISNFLSQLGVKQSSIFVWEYFNENCYAVKYKPFAVVPGQFNKYKLFAAFTASELGELLPNRITLESGEPFNSFTIAINKFYTVDSGISKTNNYRVNYECDSTELEGQDAWLRRRLAKSIYDPNLANAMGKMLIYLIENGLIKNERI